MTPILDSTRSFLLNQALLARDTIGADAYMSISIGALGHLGLSSVSPSQWEAAETAFDDLVALYAAWQIETEDAHSWASPVETGLHDPDWPEAVRVLADAINSTLNFLIALSFLQHWTPRDRVALDRLAQGVPLEVVIPAQQVDCFADEDAAFLDSISRVLEARTR